MPYEAALPAARVLGPSWRASLDLAFERRTARSVLATRHHDGPLAVQRVLHPEDASVCHVIVLHPPGGIAGGDELDIRVRAAEGAHVVATTPGATKWYRSAGGEAVQRVTLEVAAAASVEWLPQESIVFDGALASSSLDVRLHGQARLVAWDIACLGRAASGETFAHGRLGLHTRVTRDARLAWRERASIDPADPWLRSAAGLGGASVTGTLAVAAPDIEDAWLAEARACAPRRGEGACTRLPGLIIARYRGDSGECAREYFTAIWRRLREPVLGRAPIEPRIWRT